MNKKPSILLMVVALGVLSTCAVPGSDQWKIRSAATKYVRQDLKTGEKVQSINIERKLLCHVNGKDCKYAEVNCRILSYGKTMNRTLYLLMSEHCDSVYDISDVFNNEYYNSRR